MRRIITGSLLLLLAGIASLLVLLPPPESAAQPRLVSPFSAKYQSIRARFVKDFFLGGHVAEWAQGNERGFSDQTMYMGFALITFAGEARLLKQAGQNPRPAEDIIGSILRTQVDLQGEVRSLYKATPIKGWYLRDIMSAETVRGFNIAGSDFRSEKAGQYGDAAMSQDQMVSMFLGWWAVARWSTDANNVKLAKAHADAAITYLMDQRFCITYPGTTSKVPRGDDARLAAGFLCRIAEQTTGKKYYARAKIRLDKGVRKCKTCAGTGKVNAPNPNLQCLPCSGSGRLKVVVGGGKCPTCRGSGQVKLVVKSDCPVCFGRGNVFGIKCKACGGDGRIDKSWKWGKCKLCSGSGKLPSKTKDMGTCKVCGGSGRIRGEIPKVKCLVCGGSGEWNVYVSVSHPIVLGLLKTAGVAVLSTPPRIKLTTTGKVTIDRPTPGVGGIKHFARHMALVCMALEPAVASGELLPAANASSHPWSVALRAAARKDAKILVPLVPTLVKLHKECPSAGPNDKASSINWVKPNRWVHCTDLKRSGGTKRYNGLDFLSLEVLLRIAGHGSKLPVPR